MYGFKSDAGFRPGGPEGVGLLGCNVQNLVSRGRFAIGRFIVVQSRKWRECSNAMDDKMNAALDKLKANRGAVAGVVGLGVAAAASYYVIRRRGRSVVPKGGPFTAETLPAGAYDAVIVGSGPSGSTCAYYLAKAGARVALLDKETFPRDKYCGDAVRRA